mmetsp:Transcript_23899/g.49716  ORF Transcript_23899/g.49716 Transcript_23899/m.49716 type:complete len:137 (+) Transcript_23899:2-412(+)
MASLVVSALWHMGRCHVGVVFALRSWRVCLRALTLKGPKAVGAPEELEDSDSDSELGDWANDGLDWQKYLGRDEAPNLSPSAEERSRAHRQAVLASLTPSSPPPVRRSALRVRFQLDDTANTTLKVKALDALFIVR